MCVWVGVCKIQKEKGERVTISLSNHFVFYTIQVYQLSNAAKQSTTKHSGLKQYTLIIAVSSGQQSGHSLGRASSFRVSDRLQSKYWPGLWSHLNVLLGQGGDLLLSLCGCWQNSIPHGLLDWGPGFPLGCWLKLPSPPCQVGLSNAEVCVLNAD